MQCGGVSLQSIYIFLSGLWFWNGIYSSFSNSIAIYKCTGLKGLWGFCSHQEKAVVFAHFYYFIRSLLRTPCSGWAVHFCVILGCHSKQFWVSLSSSWNAFSSRLGGMTLFATRETAPTDRDWWAISVPAKFLKYQTAYLSIKFTLITNSRQASPTLSTQFSSKSETPPSILCWTRRGRTFWKSITR